MTPEEVLNLPLTDNLKNQGLGEQTIRGYFINLLYTLWNENECFSSKRPLGNSGWDYDLFVVLMKGGAISGSVDEDGYFIDVDISAADTVIQEAIKCLGKP